MRNIFFALSLFALLAGCSGDDEPSTSSAGLAFDELPSAYVEAMCSSIEKCPEAASPTRFQPSCEEELKRKFGNATHARWRDSIKAGRLQYNPDKADSCIAAIRTLGCKAATLDGIPQGCEEMFTGRLDVGARCFDDYECNADAACVAQSRDRSCSKICVARATVGQSCDKGACKPGHSCIGGTCKSNITLGNACNDESSCDSGTLCWNGICEDATKIATATEGELCNIIEDDTKIACIDGLSCVMNFDEAKRRYICASPVASGESCTLGFPNPCPNGEYCKLDENNNGLCTALPGDGEICAQDHANSDCRAGYACVFNQCTAQKFLGEPCGSASQCTSRVCVDGKCAATPACK